LPISDFDASRESARENNIFTTKDLSYTKEIQNHFFCAAGFGLVASFGPAPGIWASSAGTVRFAPKRLR
jgi:hypothetical protein